MRPETPREHNLSGGDDNELVERALRGQERAFHELVDRHAAGLMRFARALVGNADDAEDVVQETLAGAFAGLRGYRREASVKTWLTRILIRQAAGWRRKQGRRREMTEQARPASPGPGHEAAADARMDVADALAIALCAGRQRE